MPRAMLPSLSMAMLPIQKLMLLFWKVPCWNTENLPPGGVERNWYQRTADNEVAPVPGFTE